MMEKAAGGAPLAVAGDVLTVPIKPYEILTVEATYPAREHTVATLK